MIVAIRFGRNAALIPRPGGLSFVRFVEKGSHYWWFTLPWRCKPGEPVFGHRYIVKAPA